MGVIGIGVGDAIMGRTRRDENGNIMEQSAARWDANPAGGSVAIWPMDPEKMEPSGPAEVYGDWDAARYLARVVDICTYCPDYNCRDCIVNEWKEDADDEQDEN